MGRLCYSYKMADVLIQLLERLSRSPPASSRLCFKMLGLDLCSKPCLEEVDNVGCRRTRANVPEDLFCSSLSTRTEMVKHVLIVPNAGS